MMPLLLLDEHVDSPVTACRSKVFNFGLREAIERDCQAKLLKLRRAEPIKRASVQGRGKRWLGNHEFLEKVTLRPRQSASEALLCTTLLHGVLH